MSADLDNGREALATALAAGDAISVAQIAATLWLVLPRSAHREMLTLTDALEPLIERIDNADLLARVGKLLQSALSSTHRQSAVVLVRRCVARIPPASSTDPAPERWARHLAMTSLAMTELRVDNAAAAAALAQARALADPAWPPIRTYSLVEAEGHAARVRGDAAAALLWTRRTLAEAQASGRSGGSELANISDAELAVGQAAQAAASGTALIELLADRREERYLVFARMNLSAALLALDDPKRARAVLSAGWAQAPQFDLQPFFADYLALLAALEGRFDAAARLAAYADAGNARVGERQGNEAAAHARAVKVARAALGDDAFERLYAESAALRDTDIAALAFSEVVER